MSTPAYAFNAPAKNADELDKRKELASVLKQFARGEVKVDPEQMVKSGASMGVSRNQLSGLYQKYKQEFNAEGAGAEADTPTAPTTAAPTTAAPTTAAPTTAAPTTAAPTTAAPTTAAPTTAAPTAAVPATAATTTKLFQPHDVATPNLDLQKAMKKAPFGAYSDVQRQATGFRGTPLGSGGGRKGEMAGIARLLMNKAAANRERDLKEMNARRQAFVDRNKPVEGAASGYKPA